MKREKKRTEVVKGKGAINVASRKQKMTDNNDHTANVDESDNNDEASNKNGSANDDDEMDAIPAPTLSKVLTLAKPEWPILLVGVLIMIGAEATGLYNPILIGTAYDDLINPELDSSSRMSYINQTMFLAIIIHFVGVVGYFIRYAIFQIIGERVVARLRTNLYAAILQQEIAFFDKNKSGELLSRLTSDTALLQHGTSQALPNVCVGIIKVITALIIMFWISPKLAGVMLGFVFVVTVVAAQFGKLLGALSKQYQDILGHAQCYSAEALQAMRTVQSFSAEEKELQRYMKKIGNPHDYKYWYPKKTKYSKNNEATTYSVGFFKSITTSGLFSVIFGVGFAGMLLCLWYGFKLVNDGELTLGNLTAFQSYIFVIGGSLGETSTELSKLIEAKGVAGRVFYLLERVPTIPARSLSVSTKSTMKSVNRKNSTLTKNSNCEAVSVVDKAGKINTADEERPVTPLIPNSMQGAVDFNNVVFSYPSRPDVNVLRNFSLSVPANQTAALVGASGSGKSTCIALLQRFYDVSEGSITIDGHNIRNLDLQWLRCHMAYVQQEPHLFGLSIRDNILYGVDRADVSQEELEEVAKKANAYEFISQWPNKFDTLVGERGVQLSGGQKQRIAIARALVRQPRILLLDEATSALDAESEHLVQDAIDNAIVGRTVLIVAHRLSTIQRADQIVVVDEHQIVDVGTHQELSLRCSKYQDLIKRQSIIYQKQDKSPLEIISDDLEDTSN